MVTRRMRPAVTLLCAASVSSCAAIWGFEDLPVGDGGGAATVDAGDVQRSDAPAAFDSTVPGDSSEGSDAGSDVAPPVDASPVDASSCSCAAAPPMGWAGPVDLYQGPGAAPAPSCSGAYGAMAFMGNAGLVPTPATCSACSCGPAQGGTCGVHLTYFHNPCGDTQGGCNTQTDGLLAGACQMLTTVDGVCAGTPVEAFQADYAQATAGSCGAGTSSPTGPLPSWSTVAVACGLSAPADAGACSTTDICVPPQTSAFPNVCFMSAGMQSCAALPAPYNNPYVFYTAVDDTRGCSGCACGQPSPTCNLGGTATFYTDPGCTADVGSRNISTASACYSLPGSSYYSRYSPGTNLPGSCQPAGGSPTGGVTPSASSATTFCCAH
jgi:hypothetical protein